MPAAAVFILISARPRTEWVGVARDERGFLRTGQGLIESGTWDLERLPYLLETSLPGVFAVGDVCSQSIKRVASAVGEGAIVISFVHQYLGDRGR